MKKWTLLIDVARCHDCNNCFLACKDEYVGNDWAPHSAPQAWQGQRWIDILRKEGGQFPKVRVTYLPLTCQHCADGPCLTAGPEGAVYKRADGLVIIDPEKAAGHREIVEACPYGAIYWNDELRLPQKCTGCVHLLEAGWKDTRCTQACPTDALKLLHVEDTELERLAKEEGFKPFLADLTTGHRVLFKNLDRWTECFLAGSVVARDTDECVEGATVRLEVDGRKVAETTTDNYGDFWLWGLTRSTAYRVAISLSGYAPHSAALCLNDSSNLGSIFLERL